VLKDRYGNALSTTSSPARDAYVDAVDRFLSASEGAQEGFETAISEDPGFALAHVGLARCHQLVANGAEARAAMERAEACPEPETDRERAHRNALGLLVKGKVPAAYAAIREHAANHPRDAMVVQTCTGVFGLIGFSGQPGREAEQLAFTSALLPHYGDDWWFLAQHAFAQAEAGQVGPAAGTIERSLDGNPRNAHGAHIRAHIHYEAGETAAGIAYMDDWRKDYSKHGLLHCHISWHVALWALETGDEARMWQVVDADVAPGGAWGPTLNVLTDSAAILYRAELAGVAVSPERWKAVSDYASRFFPKTGLAFADVHAALAHAMAGNCEALQRIAAEARGPAADMVELLANGFGAIGAQNWSEARHHLERTMADHARIGGSRAQRDLIEYAYLSTLLKQGFSDEARRFLVTRRPVNADTRSVAGLN
jgi:Tfp pilus assembly protein PilF